MRIYLNSKQKIWTLGTMGQYFVTGRYAEWAKEELLDKDRRSVAFYRGTTPTILTVDPDLIQLIFASNFNAFPHRTPGGGSIGGGHIFGQTLDLISDMPRWKRLRSTLSAGFSTKQLNEMIHAIEASIGKEHPVERFPKCFFFRKFRQKN